MNSRVIVDTSVWSLALRRSQKSISNGQRSLRFLLEDLIIHGRSVLLGVVRQELLTGISDTDLFQSLRDRLRDFEDPQLAIDDYERAADFANQCRSTGLATSPVDILICSVAAGNDFPILTTDDDFQRYARILPIKLHPHA
jgi:predicted nucleic acid-binding protein